MHTVSELHAYLQQTRKIVIIPHQKPDGDAMGSSLGLYLYLLQFGHEVQVITPTDYPAFLKWMPGKKNVLVFPFNPVKAKKAIAQSDLIFCLDFNDLGRINELEAEVSKAQAYKVMIDHHTHPKNFDDVRYWDEKASSTCELVYRLIVQEWDDHDKLTPDIATCLYTGIMTDTGSFRFDITKPAVHRAVADLLETGIHAHLIHEQVYDSASENRLRLTGHALLNCLKVLPEKKTAYFLISKADAEKYKMEAGDTEGLVNYGLGMRGILLSVLMLEDEGLVKMSFRAKGDLKVNGFAAEHFQGGGHPKAAGGKSLLSLQETEQKFLSLLENWTF